jgi:hypothetical protein
VVVVLVAVAGGPMGTGRMADIGAPLWDVAIGAVAAMGAGGFLGGAVMTWWQRRSLGRSLGRSEGRSEGRSAAGAGEPRS